MTTWQGMVRKRTSVGDEQGVSVYQANTRNFVSGELQRRHGMAQSNLPSTGVAILGIAAGSTVNGGFVVQQTTGNGLTGQTGQHAQWDDAKLRPPVGTACALYAPRSDSGTVSGSSLILLPPNGCAGTILVTGTDDGRSRGGPCGFQFTVTADGIVVLTTGCLVNSSTSVAIPKNTRIISTAVVSGCSGPGTGNWSIGVTTP